MRIPDHAITHGGKFHADDVFSSALLKLLNPELTITRTFNPPENPDGIVFDLGYGAFDHHQSTAEIRENGVPYAAFGLLWRAFGESLVGAEEAARFDEKFVQPLDLDDNTGCGNMLAGIIAAFNPCWDSTDSADICFEQAVEFARVILAKKMEFIHSHARARSLVLDALASMEDGIVILSRFAPWKPVLEKSPAIFVVYPSQRGGYSAQGVPDPEEPGALKCAFPAGWAGKSTGELQQLSGISTLRFCHNHRFLIAADTMEDTIAACRIALAETP